MRCGRQLVDPAVAAGRVSRALENAAVICGTDGAALMLLDGREDLRAVGASSGEGMELEIVQQLAGRGPAFDCVAGDAPVVVEDMFRQPDGRVLAPKVAPVRAVLSLPVRTYGRLVGSLNLYRYRPTVWGPDQIAAAERTADIIAVFLETLARPRDPQGSAG